MLNYNDDNKPRHKKSKFTVQKHSTHNERSPTHKNV